MGGGALGGAACLVSFFFFSSRRRHTRFDCDWSSDVCSSDLPSVKGRIDHFGVDLKQRRLFVAALGNDTLEVVDLMSGQWQRSVDGFGKPQGRSGERRVGKEGRSRWAPDHLKKKK